LTVGMRISECAFQCATNVEGKYFRNSTLVGLSFSG
jgi:hypothetical protein